jgi:HSP20 family protein
MAIIRYNPFGEVGRLRREMDKLFEDMIGSEKEEDIARGSWFPRVNINERKEDIIVTADLPGLNKDDISINMENKILTITGERKFESNEKDDNYHRIEKVYGKFSRSFRLPDSVSDEGVKAEYKNGELHITLKKREEAKPKSIPISIK